MTAQDGGFAALLRQRRRTLRLTQADLAARAGVAVRTVRELERGRTNRPQRSTALLLADALELSGAERDRFLAAARPGGLRVPAQRTPPAEESRVGSPLPPPPTLIGRDRTLAQLAELISTPGRRGPTVVTVVGLAGVGKSALVLAVAHAVAERFPGGVAGITVDEQGEIVETLATICFVHGVADLAELGARSVRQPVLLVVDAVERAPDKVREVLRRLPPGVRVLMAGQAPVRVPGERVWPLAPLATPPARYDMPLAEVVAYPAAALFLDRLARVRPEPPAPDEVPALIGLVRRLGGLPLALELAAAHGRLLRLPEILQRYGDRVLDLGEGAEQTLREAVAGSYRLLNPAEQYGLRRLSVFRHRWSMELAERLLDTGEDPLPLLDRLVGLGLVAVSGAREHRFRLLDVVRDFATEQAARHGELAAARRAHARVIAEVAERTAPQLAGPHMRLAVARLDDLAADVWAALSHAANDDPHTALRLAARLPRWWRLRGRDVTGRRWLRRLLDDPRTADAGPALRAWAQVGLAQLANEHGEGAAELAATASALAEFRRLGDVAGELAASNVLSALCLAEGRHEDARRYTAAALAAAMRAGRLREQAVAQTNLTWHDIRTGDLLAARRRLASADRLAAEVGDDRLRVLVAANLAEVARLQERYEEAVTRGCRVLVRLAEVGDPGHRRRVLGTVGQALAALGRLREAERALERLRALDEQHLVAGEAAMIEARLALARGDRVGAAEWFESAVAGFRHGQDRRDLVEALVGLAACTSEPLRRAAVMADLERVAAESGVTLLPFELRLLAENSLRTPCGPGAASR